MPFGADLSHRLGVPSSIDSDVNLVTLAEHWFGQARDLNDFLVVNVERSLGLGILHNGELFRGANGLSPDLGDLMVRSPERRRAARRRGLGGVRADRSRGAVREASLTRPSSGRAMALLLKRAAAGDKRCARVLAAAGEALGFAVASLITLFAPPKVIISGRAMATSDHFIEPLRKTVAALLPASLADVSDIVVREWSDENLGAGRRGDDAPRSLRRAVGNDGAGVDARSGCPAAENCDATGRNRRHRLRKHQLRLSDRGEKVPDPQPYRALRRQSRGRRGPRGGIWHSGASGRRAVLADPAVEIILNLTVPNAHVDVGLKAIAAGKHVHSEKPLGVAVAEARRLIEAAAAKGLRLGSRARHLSRRRPSDRAPRVDEGLIGRPIGGAAFFMCPGHERWHPNPGFYYLAGGGPMLDMGPYYVTDLVNLLGPVASVSGVATRTRSERVVTSQPLAGARIPVEVATHVTGTLMFVSGAAVTMTMSFDVARHRHGPIELYGEAGSLIVPDPNYFGGKVEFATAAEDWREIPTEGPYADGNYRILGLADMAQAIRSGRPHRASGELAFHVLEVMEAFQTSSDAGKAVAISSRPERPAPLPAALGRRTRLKERHD